MLYSVKSLTLHQVVSSQCARVGSTYQIESPVKLKASKNIEFCATSPDWISIFFEEGRSEDSPVKIVHLLNATIVWRRGTQKSLMIHLERRTCDLSLAIWIYLEAQTSLQNLRLQTVSLAILEDVGHLNKRSKSVPCFNSISTLNISHHNWYSNLAADRFGRLRFRNREGQFSTCLSVEEQGYFCWLHRWRGFKSKF